MILCIEYNHVNNKYYTCMTEGATCQQLWHLLGQKFFCSCQHTVYLN